MVGSERVMSVTRSARDAANRYARFYLPWELQGGVTPVYHFNRLVLNTVYADSVG